jgi:hypothetical protein
VTVTALRARGSRGLASKQASLVGVGVALLKEATQRPVCSVCQKSHRYRRITLHTYAVLNHRPPVKMLKAR